MIGIVIAGVGVYTGVINIQELFGQGDGDDQNGVSGNVTVAFINVGQGDSILIQLPDGSNVLIDAGGNLGADVLLEALHSYDVETIDCFFITHPHADHINYADEVLEEFDVENILMTNYEVDTVAYQNLIDAVDAEGCTRIQLGIDMEIEWTGGAVITVLYFDDNADNPNDSSIVLRLDYGYTSFLFTGDIGFDVEDKLIDDHADVLDADVLKVSHHGSAYATSAEFLTYVTPSISVISVGENTYGHPDAGTIDRLEASGSTVYMTLELGDIVVTSDGYGCFVSTDPEMGSI